MEDWQKIAEEKLQEKMKELGITYYRIFNVIEESNTLQVEIIKQGIYVNARYSDFSQDIYSLSMSIDKFSLKTLGLL